MLRAAFACLSASFVLLFAASAARAQEGARETVVPQENVRFDYARVLDVNPIYQVLRTTRVERRCAGDEPPPGKLSRVVGAVKGALSAKASEEECRMVPVTRDFRRPIAYDVDYEYRGSKFRTRLAQDPGNRLRVRVSVTPQPIDP